ncbi:helix-turn-helix domain-containing protein [Mycobacterium fragae]|uniref:helix-turn-helix domain-containing protein n=1 Tax=Mycobacterium fragae TaxID=1260918 RepID=UPI001D0A43FE
MVVLEVSSGHLSVTAAARAYGISRQHICRLLKRYQLGGLDASSHAPDAPPATAAPYPMTSSPPSCCCAKSSPPKAWTPAH